MPKNAFAYRWVLGAALIIMAGMAPLIGGTPPVTASLAHPAVQVVKSDVTPSPRPPRPQINPVPRSDDGVVRPDGATGEGVNDLPTSGIGFTDPANEDVQHWTTVVIAALALNAMVLFGVAAWSLRRRRFSSGATWLGPEK